MTSTADGNKWRLTEEERNLLRRPLYLAGLELVREVDEKRNDGSHTLLATFYFTCYKSKVQGTEE